MGIERIVLVRRLTRLEEGIRKKFNTLAQAKFFIEKRGHSFEDYEREHRTYQESLEALLKALPAGVPSQLVDREFLPNFLFTEKDAVVTLGQDGLVVNTAKYLSGQPVVAVNPDPERFDGVLLPFLPHEAGRALQGLARGDAVCKGISMARVDLNDGQSLHAVNDFFIGPRSHTSARYTLQYRSQSERQSSSGVIVSTPAGSTGWASSLFNMARGMARYLQAPLIGEDWVQDWSARKLLFVVREPFRSKWSGAGLVAGELEEGEPLTLMSHMPEDGVIFSDGVLADFLEFNSGVTATVTLSGKVTNLVMNASRPFSLAHGKQGN